MYFVIGPMITEFSYAVYSSTREFKRLFPPPNAAAAKP